MSWDGPGTVQECISSGCCTVSAFGLREARQRFYACLDCGVSVCQVCSVKCHAGHKVESREPAMGSCSCGLYRSVVSCQMVQSPPWNLHNAFEKLPDDTAKWFEEPLSRWPIHINFVALRKEGQAQMDMLAEARLIARRLRFLEGQPRTEKSERMIYVICERYLHRNRTVTFHLSFVEFPDDDRSSRRGIIVGPWHLPESVGPGCKDMFELANLTQKYGCTPEKVPFCFVFFLFFLFFVVGVSSARQGHFVDCPSASHCRSARSDHDSHRGRVSARLGSGQYMQMWRHFVCSAGLRDARRRAC